MQQWEYRVLTLRAGHYTEALNEYGRDGWELVGVASDVRGAPVQGGPAGTTFMPRAFGRLEDAAAKLNKLGSSDSPDVPEPTTATTLLWVLRRPLNED
ncbi:MAG TPA: hypothetical protein VH108_00845 [Gaiellaceae bacterium]|jgi:hypothetical protein|nr:hypothetical protein [Gaiellaceae bacterium]